MSIKQKHHFFLRETGDSPLHLMDFGVADGVPMPQSCLGQISKNWPGPSGRAQLGGRLSGEPPW
jgi:hypothetical protein